MELYIGLDFSSFCNNDCRYIQLRRLTSQPQTVENSLDGLFILKLYSINPSESIHLLNIKQIFICKLKFYFKIEIKTKMFRSKFNIFK